MVFPHTCSAWRGCLSVETHMGIWEGGRVGGEKRYLGRCEVHMGGNSVGEEGRKREKFQKNCVSCHA